MATDYELGLANLYRYKERAKQRGLTNDAAVYDFGIELFKTKTLRFVSTSGGQWHIILKRPHAVTYSEAYSAINRFIQDKFS